MTKIYVGNLPFSFSENDLKSTFQECGAITDVYLPTDRTTGRPRGFAFVTFESTEGFKAALKLNGQEMGGRTIRIDAASDNRGSGGAARG